MMRYTEAQAKAFVKKNLTKRDCCPAFSALLAHYKQPQHECIASAKQPKSLYPAATQDADCLELQKQKRRFLRICVSG